MTGWVPYKDWTAMRASSVVLCRFFSTSEVPGSSQDIAPSPTPGSGRRVTVPSNYAVYRMARDALLDIYFSGVQKRRVVPISCSQQGVPQC